MVDVVKVDRLIEAFQTDTSHQEQHEAGKECDLCQLAKDLSGTKISTIMVDNVLVNVMRRGSRSAIFDGIVSGFALGKRYAENEVLEKIMGVGDELKTA